jgi:multicomponent Na+:H+ antiporter subunit F
MIEFAIPALVVGSLLAALLGAIRLLRGPSHADRIIALDLLLAAAVALCIAAALETGRTVYLDVAIGTALVSFVGTVAWARLVDRAAAIRAAIGSAGRETRGRP